MSLVGRARTLGTLAVIAVAIGPFPVFAAGEGNLLYCRDESHIQLRSDDWYAIDGPVYDEGEGPAEIVDMEVSPNSMRHLYATNGVSVKRSTDDGCTWNSRIFRPQDTVNDAKPDAVDPILHNYALVDMQVLQRSNEADNDEVWLLSYDDTGGVHRPRIWASPSAQAEGAAFTEHSAGLPTFGTPIMFAVTRQSGAAFALIDVALPTVAPPSTDVQPEGPTLYYVADIWEEDPDKVDQTVWDVIPMPEGFTALDGMVSDPDNSRGLLAWQGNKVAYTADHYNWSEPKDLEGPVGAVVIQRNPDGQEQSFLYAFGNGAGNSDLLWRSEDGAKSWVSEQAPAGVTGAAVGHKRNMLAVTTANGGMWGWDTRLTQWVAFTPTGVTGLAQPEFLTEFGKTTELVAHDDTHFYRRALFREALFKEKPKPPLFKGKISDLPPLTEVPNAEGPDLLLPATFDVTVEPGATVELPFEYVVQPHPLKLDVYFLVDTTGSMRPAIEGLRIGMTRIADTLVERGIDTWFGVGDVKDIRTAAPNDCFMLPDQKTPSCTYRAVRKVSPYGPGLKLALQLLKDGGGGDLPEAQTIGLKYAIREEGMPGIVDERQHAGFRPGAISVILTITDEAFKSGGDYPTIDEAIDTLVSANVFAAGILVDNRTEGAGTGLENLQTVAGKTETFATESGVDCNEDKVVREEDGDVPPFGPLVCLHRPGSGPGSEVAAITPAIISLLLGVPDPGPLAVVPLGDTSVIEKMSGDVLAYVNMKAKNTQKFAVTFTCSERQDGQDIPVVLEGRSRNEPTARSFGAVHCRAPKVDPPVIQVPPVIPPRAIVPPPPAVPNPVPNPNPPPNPNPNINPNSGFASQENQQFQLASVTQGEGQQQQDEEATELAMSALDRRPEPSTLPLYAAAGLMTSLAAATAFRRRTRTAVARARIR